MENKKKNKIREKVGVISGIIFLLLVFLIYAFLVVSLASFKFESNLYKTLLIVESKYDDFSTAEQKANDYYDEASYHYEKQNYNLVESNCRLARTSFSDASQGYNEIVSYLKSSNMEDKLIEIEIQSYGVLSEIQLNLYEACEHFESAVRYYDIYYNTNVPYDDISYDMGTGEIDMMNEKIVLHDENVRKYNNLLSDFQIELEKRLEYE